VDGGHPHPILRQGPATRPPGHAPADIGAELGILSGWGAVSFAVALRVFRWQ